MNAPPAAPDADPFAPPQAALVDPPPSPMAGWKAVLLGFAVDFGGSMIGGVIYAFVWAMWLAMHGASPGVLQTTLMNPRMDSAYMIGALLLGASFSFLGGLLCARLSRRTDFRLGLILAGLSAGAGVLMSLQSRPIGEHAFLATLTVGAILLGTRVGRVAQA